MDFYKRLHLVCNAIPWGQTAAYGQLALLCGRPRHARLVGYALNHGRSGDVPAHRVVNVKGYLTGAASFERLPVEQPLGAACFQAVSGISGSGFGQQTADHVQKRLLESEGVEVFWDLEKQLYRVDMRKYAWQNTMEQALAFREEFEREGI